MATEDILNALIMAVVFMVPVALAMLEAVDE